MGGPAGRSSKIPSQQSPRWATVTAVPPRSDLALSHVGPASVESRVGCEMEGVTWWAAGAPLRAAARSALSGQVTDTWLPSPGWCAGHIGH